MWNTQAPIPKLARAPPRWPLALPPRAAPRRRAVPLPVWLALWPVASAAKHRKNK